MPIDMPRPRRPADAPTAVVIASLDALDLGVRPLVVDEGSGQLVAALQARGCEPRTWQRYADDGAAAEAWPRATDCTSALVRLGKDKRALAMALEAAASVVAPGGTMVLFGANTEGVRSAAKAMDRVSKEIITVDTRRHSRVLAGRRREIEGLRGTLASWREVHEITFSGHARSWVRYPGVFAAGGLDPGTALLLEHLPALDAGAAVLDLACGTGIIGAAVRERVSSATVDMVDNDAVAIAAARENVPDATVICGDGLAAAPRGRYDAILSNPPIHDGVAESFAFLQQLITEASSRLKPGGVLQVVIQSRIRAQPWFEAAFRSVEVVAQDRRFQVICALATPSRATRRAGR